MVDAGIPLPIVIEKDGNTEKAYDLYSRLLKDRIIFLGTGVNDAVANSIIGQLLFLEADDPDKDIYMYINSPGGHVSSGFGIYDTMCYVKPEITTVCVGQAASMGCFLLAGGSPGRRFALPNARIMMHHVQGGYQGSAPDVSIHYEEMMRINERLLKILSQNTGRSFEETKELFERDKWMNVDEAREFGIIDDVHTKSVRESDE